MLETKITELIEKQKLIKNKLNNHKISFLECKEELKSFKMKLKK
jgi:hypothetical protein